MLLLDTFSSEKRSSIMRLVRSTDTAPEKGLRSLLHKLGFRFRLHRKDLPGNPDIGGGVKPHQGSCMDVTIRCLTSADLREVDQLRAELGWNQTISDWRRLLALAPEGCFAAERNGKIAGTCTSVCFGNELAWIGMMMVHPASRRQGIGGRLLRSCIWISSSARFEMHQTGCHAHGATGLYAYRFSAGMHPDPLGASRAAAGC
ncbi:MAG: hypothetical protein CVU64_09575 [Deltaproteobacteria bacterium HGW-Deltaproteobacteria-21]|nr:MAG: hypothetical protein CVU64_09575 [Deltaproteobacteria bacterium HGW-Deltaproteobacteria-21]